MQRPVSCWGALDGRLPWQLQWLFKITLQNEDGALVEYWVAQPLTTIVENSGNLDPVLKFLQLIKAWASIFLHVFRVGHIIGCAHAIQEIVACSRTGDERTERGIGNSYIHLATRNDVYNWRRGNCILRTGRSNAKRASCRVTHCIPILMQVCTHWSHSYVILRLATMPEWSLKRRDQQNAKKHWNSNRRVINSGMHCIDHRRGAIRQRGDSDGCDWGCSLRRSQSPRTEYFVPNALSGDWCIILCNHSCSYIEGIVESSQCWDSSLRHLVLEKALCQRNDSVYG